MKKYLHLFFIFFQNNLVREIEFRGNFIMGIIIDCAWVIMQLVTLEIYFSFTTNIAGWTKAEVFALVGIFRIIKGLFDVFFRLNLIRLPELVGKGDVDFILCKPVNSIFLVSTRYHELGELFSTLSGILVLFYASTLGNFSITIFNSVGLFISLLFGLLAFYSLILILSSLSFFFTRITALRSFYDIISTTIRMPIDVLITNKQAAALFLPLAVIVTFPSKIFLGKISFHFMFLAILVSLAIFYIAQKFWFFSLRHYSSASS